jgi:hypothetical protein
VDSAVVFDEAQVPKFIHEEVHSGARCANHLRQHLSRYFGEHLLRLVLLAIARQQQESPRQTFLTGVEKLIDQVLLDSYVSRRHVRDEAVRELVFLVEHANHLFFLNDEYSSRCVRTFQGMMMGRTRP